jgi:hypothetical protein
MQHSRRSRARRERRSVEAGGAEPGGEVVEMAELASAADPP